MEKHACICLQCGRNFQIVLEPEADFNDQKCPICGGTNVVKDDPMNFLEALFKGAGGG